MEPFRIVVLGDFSGRVQRPPLIARTPLRVDADNVDTAIESFRIELALPKGRLEIRDLDSFHPDRIYASSAIFREAREERLRLLSGERTGESQPTSLVDEILGGPAAAAAPAKAAPEGSLEAFIADAVRPYATRGEDPHVVALCRNLDREITSTMRSVLHEPRFQAMEAAWRSVDLLVRELAPDAELQLWIVDVTKDELADHIPALRSLLMNRCGRVSVLAGLYSFGTQDCELLGRLAELAQVSRAPWLAEADLSLLPGGEGDREWVEFRRSPEARWIGLALPRVLLRAPYGEESVPCEAFPFEEVEGKPQTTELLYANPAIVCAALLARPESRVFTGLPVHFYRTEEEEGILPCTEIELTVELAEALLDTGIMAIAARRNTDAVQLLRFQSVADPPTALAGVAPRRD